MFSIVTPNAVDENTTSRIASSDRVICDGFDNPDTADKFILIVFTICALVMSMPAINSDY